MTAVYNVNRSVADPFYRYKMPAIIAKVEGKGNGIKTAIPNMSEIACALDRPPAYVTKYFGIEMGAQTNIDDKNDRYIVNGAHSAEDLQIQLDGFIQKFVLCPNCDSPETELNVVKKTIYQKCAACGYTGLLKYSTHRLFNYILNRPPTKTAKKGKKAEADKEKKNNKEEDSQCGDDATLNGDIAAPELDEQRDDDDDWSADISEEAIRLRENAQITGAVSALIASADAERPEKERVDMFYHFITEQAKQNPLPTRVLLDKARLLDVLQHSGIVLIEALFSGTELVPLVKKYEPVLKAFGDGQTKIQRNFLNGIEMKIKDNNINLKQVPNILNALYQLDIVEESVFYSWHKKVSKRYVPKELSQQIRDAAQPFIEWLQEAEEEDEDDEPSNAEDDLESSKSSSSQVVRILICSQFCPFGRIHILVGFLFQ
eukprot:gene2454-5389_t